MSTDGKFSTVCLVDGKHLLVESLSKGMISGDKDLSLNRYIILLGDLLKAENKH